MSPVLLSPTIRYTPISNDFVSMFYSNKEYISNTDIITSKITIRSKTSCKKITLNSCYCKESKSVDSTVMGKNPSPSSISDIILDIFALIICILAYS